MSSRIKRIVRSVKKVTGGSRESNPSTRKHIAHLIKKRRKLGEDASMKKDIKRHRKAINHTGLINR